jgi:hypothetical protein
MAMARDDKTDKRREEKTRQERWAHNTRHPTGWKDLASATIERFSSPVPDPKVGRPGNPEHTRSVDNKGLLVVIRGKQGREGRREKLSSFHFNAFSHWIIIVVFMECNNKILVFTISSNLSIVLVLGRMFSTLTTYSIRYNNDTRYSSMVISILPYLRRKPSK